jgi:DNA-binding NarL/FixJ family response regulator
VLLVDDHAIVREGLRALLDQTDSLQIVGEAADCTAALELVRQLRPDIVLMDFKMPGLPAADAIRTIRAQYPATQVLVLTSYAEDAQVEQVLRAGALGYVIKSIVAADLVRAIATVARGEAWLHAEAQRSLVNRMRRPADPSPLALLTERELSILRLLAKGKSNREIGRVLHLTEGTVKGYVSKVLAKLKLTDRTQAALLAVRLGVEQGGRMNSQLAFAFDRFVLDPGRREALRSVWRVAADTKGIRAAGIPRVERGSAADQARAARHALAAGVRDGRRPQGVHPRDPARARRRCAYSTHHRDGAPTRVSLHRAGRNSGAHGPLATSRSDLDLRRCAPGGCQRRSLIANHSLTLCS